MILILIFHLIFVSSSLNGEWTLIKGNPRLIDTDLASSLNLSNTDEFYEINSPGKRAFSAVLKFSNEKIFLFGGSGYYYGGTIWTGLNDLWEYSPTRKMWRFLRGGFDKTGNSQVYSESEYSDYNVPGYRYSPGMVINPINDDDTFLLVAGSIYHEVWEFHVNRNQWRIRKSQDSANYYGNYNSSERQVLSGRAQFSIWGIDDFVLIFGGYSCKQNDYSNKITMNDIWKYYPKSNEYQYIRGTNNTIRNNLGVYGIKGENNSIYEPCGRFGNAFWIYNKEIYIYGGQNLEDYINFSDTWSYNVELNQWTWLSGNKPNLQSDVILEINNLTSINENLLFPPARGTPFFWQLGQEKAIIYGGDFFFYEKNETKNYNYGDMWEYDFKTNIYQCILFCGDKIVNTTTNTTNSSKLEKFYNFYEEAIDRNYFSNTSYINGTEIFYGEPIINSRTAGSSFFDDRGNLLIFGGYYTSKDIWFFDVVPKCKNYSIYEDYVCSRHGECINDTCICQNTYSGDLCNEWKCYGIYNYNKSVCNGRGKCSDTDHCNCDYYTGDNCSIHTCNKVSKLDSSVCNGKGECIKYDVCNCTAPYYGKYCQEKIENVTYYYSSKTLKIQWEVEITIIEDKSFSFQYFNCTEVFVNWKELGVQSARCVFSTTNQTHKFNYLKVLLGNDNSIVGIGTELIFHPISSENVNITRIVDGIPEPINTQLILLVVFVAVASVCSVLAIIALIVLIILIIRNLILWRRLNNHYYLDQFMEKPIDP